MNVDIGNINVGDHSSLNVKIEKHFHQTKLEVNPTEEMYKKMSLQVFKKIQENEDRKKRIFKKKQGKLGNKDVLVADDGTVQIGLIVNGKL